MYKNQIMEYGQYCAHDAELLADIKAAVEAYAAENPGKITGIKTQRHPRDSGMSVVYSTDSTTALSVSSYAQRIVMVKRFGDREV